jgi:Icc-related predicted phosphoesterase
VKIQVMSDLHIRHWGTYMGVNYWQQTFPAETQTDADVIVLAGDIVDLGPREWRWSVARLQEFMARYKRVVYVPGNHEFYGTAIANTDLDQLAKDSGVDVLRPGKTVVIDGYRFIGGVMFQPNKSHPDLPWPANPISDHGCIRDFRQQAPGEFRALKAWLEAELKAEDIVVTHHAPCLGSLDAQWVGDACNRWFITPEMEPLIDARQPRLWLHGHVHTPFDYMRGNTRIIANPKGYPNEGVRFNPKLIVEVP